MVHLLIDGYNLFHSLKKAGMIDQESLEDQRNELLELLHQYQVKRQVDITIVFDSSEPGGLMPDHDRLGKIKIVFARNSESADVWIHEACRKKPGGYAVVSNDLEVIASARDFECTPLNNEDLIPKLRSSLEPTNDNPYFEDKDDDGPLYPRVTTKKRGSARKASKKDRRKKGVLKNL